MMSRSIAILGIITLLVGLSGCGGGTPKTTPAKGIVTRAGNPCSGAMVVFHPLVKERANDPKPVGTVDEKGVFVLTTYQKDDGAVPGEYGVTIVWNTKSPAGGLSLSGEGQTGTDQLGNRYGDPRNPRFKVTVENGKPNEFKFEVE